MPLKNDWDDRKTYRSKKEVEAVQLLADGVADGTAFVLTTPTGQKLPAVIGGYLVEENGAQRVVPREEFEGGFEEVVELGLSMGKRS